MKNKKRSGRENNIIGSDTRFAVTEGYKEIRANIGFAIPKQGSKVIMVTSAVIGEGKTTTAVNLSITIAQTGARVLIIDADMRKPRTHVMLGVKAGYGLSNYLSNMAGLDDVIRDTSMASLKCISAGTIPPNPGELLSSPKMKETFDCLRSSFDYIILDTPPVCIVADALPIAKLCDGVVLVVKQMYSTYPTIYEAIEKLKFADANVAGMILNDIHFEGSRGYYTKYGYNKYGYYKYGYEGGKRGYGSYPDDAGQPESEAGNEKDKIRTS